jgi:hypothetical protein
VLATLKELQLAKLNVFFRLSTLCSARVSALIIVLSGSPCVGDFSDFERGQIVGARCMEHL